MSEVTHAYITLESTILDVLPLADARRMVCDSGGFHTAYYYGETYNFHGNTKPKRVWFKLNKHDLTGDRYWLVVYDDVPSTVLLAEMLRNG